MLYGVRSTDAITFLAASALLGAVGLLASCLPARRAGACDPAAVLRQD
jgi:ABC-type lipoprotein release transport system permease subunit